MYNIPNSRYLLKSLPLTDNWIKVYWMRAGSGPHATFAGEQVIDELAHAAKMDPVAFRIQNVVQGNDWSTGPDAGPAAGGAERGHEGGELAAEGDGLEPVGRERRQRPRVSPGRTSTTRRPTAQTAAIADIEVNKKTGKITVKHVYQAVSAGSPSIPAGSRTRSSAGSRRSSAACSRSSTATARRT